MILSQWCVSLAIVARELGINVSEENLTPFIHQVQDSDTLIKGVSEYLGIVCEKSHLKLDSIPAALYPVGLSLSNKQLAVIHRVEGSTAFITYTQAPGIQVKIPLAELEALREGVLWIFQRNEVYFGRKINTWLHTQKESWLWALIRKDLRFYLVITVSALFGNILTLASALFSMQVYDRVIPAQSFSTLWVLFSGVLLALLADMMLKMSRSRLADAIGKRADIQMSSLFYARALGIKNSARPDSTGVFIAQIREIEHVRELLTSTTVLAIVDMPFVMLFLALIWSIGGWLVLPVMLAIPLIVIPGIIIQVPLAKLSRKGNQESALRNALLVETVQGLEDIKLTQSEDRFLGSWNHCVGTSSQVALEQRHWSCLLGNWCQFVQQAVYTCVIALGVYLVIDNTITTGTLVACSILSSRTVGPLGQITNVLTRWQQAKISLSGLNEFLARPLEQRHFSETSHLTTIRGNYAISQARFRFANDAAWAINIDTLNIKAGEKIGIVGTIGAGKSTLLRLLSGMADSAEGEVVIDDVAMSNLSVTELRYGVGYLQQDAQLFLGTIRDNILLGNPHASAEEIAQSLNIAGAAGVLKNEHGLDLTISEGGKGLSGGQKQALLLARTLIRKSNVLLLDEPTASMDERTEVHVVNSLREYCRNRTLIVVTHRRLPLEMVDRIIVMDQGKIALDGPKDVVLAKLQSAQKAGE
ncbi:MULTISPECIES: type I secretion system permease/ATPase [Enterobacterales]|uniref:type I secretion system permease/ATPase n=1 Tax=Enterobacterales TaxID=91347 RepID=UPI002EDAE570